MNYALIVAAGSGTRMGNNLKPKQFLLVKNKPLFIYSSETFNNHPDIDKIVIVTAQEYIDEVKDLCQKYKITKLVDVVIGGKTRQESVYNGLLKIKSLSNNLDSDIVLIHDAARPLVSQDIISSNIKECLINDAVTTVIPSSDTIIRSLDEKIINDVPLRKELYQSQTPQTFKLALILSAHELAKKNNCLDITDDAQLVLKIGKNVHLVKGNKRNFKVTTSDDLAIFEALI